MKRSRFTETQIVAILKEADSGMKVKEICSKPRASSPKVCLGATGFLFRGGRRKQRALWVWSILCPRV